MGYSGFNYFNRPVVAPSSTNTPQEIWDQITLGSFQSWNIAQGGDIEEAKRVAFGVALDEEYDDLVGTFANGGTATIPLGVAHEETAKPLITSGSYEGVDATGLGLLEFTKQDIISADPRHPDYVNVVVRLERGTAADSMRWVLVRTTKADYP